MADNTEFRQADVEELVTELVTLVDVKLSKQKAKCSKPKTPKMSVEERKRLRLQKELEKARKLLEIQKKKEEEAQLSQQRTEERRRNSIKKQLEKQKILEQKLEEKQQREKEKEEKELEKEKLRLEKLELVKEQRLIKQQRKVEESLRRKEEKAAQDQMRKEQGKDIHAAESSFLNKFLKKTHPTSSDKSDSSFTASSTEIHRPKLAKNTLDVLISNNFVCSEYHTPWLDTIKGLRPAKKVQSVSDVEIVGCSVDNGPVRKRHLTKAKLIQFYENLRPPYYGTFRKKSNLIKPRRVFARDTSLVDYEYNSDDDWESEPEDAEELNSDREKSDDEKGSDDEEEDDGFFVPHGYLSSDEGENCAEEEESEEDSSGKENAKPTAAKPVEIKSKCEEEGMQPKDRKVQMKYDQQFDLASKNIRHIKPQCYGVSLPNGDGCDVGVRLKRQYGNGIDISQPVFVNQNHVGTTFEVLSSLKPVWLVSDPAQFIGHVLQSNPTA